MRRMCEFFITALIAGILYSGCLTPVEAQNVLCTTRPAGDNTNSCASTAFVRNAIGGLPSGLANPTAFVGLTIVNGSATTAMRSDAAPPLSSAVQSALTGVNHSLLLGTGAFGYGSLGPSSTIGSLILGKGSSADPAYFTPTNIATFYATAYGAVCDGTTDDTTAIQAAIAAAGNNRVILPGGTCVISTSGAGLTKSKATLLQGAGVGGARGSGSNPLAGTRLLCGGSGAMLTETSPSAGPKIMGGGVVGIAFDGNSGLCSIGIDSYSVENATYDVHFVAFPTAGMRTGVVATISSGDNRYWTHNILRITGDQTAGGAGPILKFTSSATASTIFNRILLLSGSYFNACGLDITGADSNVFDLVQLFTAGGGTAPAGVCLRAGATSLQTASYNTFVRMNPGAAGLLVEGTNAAAVAANFNVVDIYDTVDGAPVPSKGTGVVLTWCDNANLNCHFGGNVDILATKAYQFGGTNLLAQVGNFNQIYSPTGSGTGAVLSFGNVSDPRLTHDATTHQFRSLGGTTLFFQADVTGILDTNIVAPSTPASGLTRIYTDSTDKRLHDKNDAGTIGTTVVAVSCTSQFVSAISTAGVATCSSPTAAEIALTNTHILVGNVSNIAVDVALSGDATMANTGALTIANNAVTLAKLATQGANTVLGNATAGSAVPTALSMTSCSTASSAVIWTTNTGFGCNTSITANAIAVGAITGLGTGVATALAVNVGAAGAFVTNGGALGSPSSVGTMPAFTLGGTIAGGGNQLNNIIIGTITPLAGHFTTLDTTGNFSVAASAQYQFGGVQFIIQSGNYNQFSDPSGAVGLTFGNTGDPTNYFDNTTTKFRARGGGTTYAQFTNGTVAFTAPAAAGNNILCYTAGVNGAVSYANTLIGCVPSAMSLKNMLGVFDSEAALRGIASLDVGIYTYKPETGLAQNTMIGLYAEQMCAIDLRLCHWDEQGRIDNYDKIGAMALSFAAIKALKAANDNMKIEFDEFKRKVAR